jgi:hypothetical protein
MNEDIFHRHYSLLNFLVDNFPRPSAEQIASDCRIIMSGMPRHCIDPNQQQFRKIIWRI